MLVEFQQACNLLWGDRQAGHQIPNIHLEEGMLLAQAPPTQAGWEVKEGGQERGSEKWLFPSLAPGLP